MIIGKSEPKYKVGQEVFCCSDPNRFVVVILDVYETYDGWEYEVEFPYWTEVIPEKDLACFIRHFF